MTAESDWYAAWRVSFEEEAERLGAAQVRWERESARLSRWNRLRAARRWPAGVLGVCLRLERKHPGWSMYWLPENTISGWERPAGFVATRPVVSLVGGDELRRLPEDGVHRTPHVFAVDTAGLEERIAAMEKRLDAEAEMNRRLGSFLRDPLR